MAWRSTASSLSLHDGIGLAKKGPALGVPDDHIADVQLRQHFRAHLARVGAVVLEMAGLGAKSDRDRVGLEGGLHRAQGGERGVQGHLGVLRQRRRPKRAASFCTTWIAS